MTPEDQAAEAGKIKALAGMLASGANAAIDAALEEIFAGAINDSVRMQVKFLLLKYEQQSLITKYKATLASQQGIEKPHLDNIIPEFLKDQNDVDIYLQLQKEFAIKQGPISTLASGFARLVGVKQNAVNKAMRTMNFERVTHLIEMGNLNAAMIMFKMIKGQQFSIELCLEWFAKSSKFPNAQEFLQTLWLDIKSHKNTLSPSLYSHMYNRLFMRKDNKNVLIDQITNLVEFMYNNKEDSLIIANIGSIADVIMQIIIMNPTLLPELLNINTSGQMSILEKFLSVGHRAPLGILMDLAKQGTGTPLSLWINFNRLIDAFTPNFSTHAGTLIAQLELNEARDQQKLKTKEKLQDIVVRVSSTLEAIQSLEAYIAFGDISLAKTSFEALKNEVAQGGDGLKIFKVLIEKLEFTAFFNADSTAGFISIDVLEDIIRISPSINYDDFRRLISVVCNANGKEPPIGNFDLHVVAEMLTPKDMRDDAAAVDETLKRLLRLIFVPQSQGRLVNFVFNKTKTKTKTKTETKTKTGNSEPIIFALHSLLLGPPPDQALAQQVFSALIAYWEAKDPRDSKPVLVPTPYFVISVWDFVLSLLVLNKGLEIDEREHLEIDQEIKNLLEKLYPHLDEILQIAKKKEGEIKEIGDEITTLQENLNDLQGESEALIAKIAKIANPAVSNREKEMFERELAVLNENIAEKTKTLEDMQAKLAKEREEYIPYKTAESKILNAHELAVFLGAEDADFDTMKSLRAYLDLERVEVGDRSNRSRRP